MNKIVLAYAAFAFSAALFAGGAPEEAVLQDDRLSVFVSILPQKYFVERISGDRVAVQVMVAPGGSPATYEPTPRQMMALGDAELFFTIGVPFEQAFLPVVSDSLPQLKLIATDEGIEKRHLGTHSPNGEDEHEDEHEEGAPDPHVWMDPLLVKHQARIIKDALIQADPAGREDYESGFREFSADLDQLHAELTEILAPMKGSILFVYHPAFGYLADRYGLEQVAIETGGKEPGAAQLEEVVEHARQEGVRVIFVQPEFPQASGKAVAEAIDGAVVPVATLKADYLANMREVAHAIRDGLR